MNRTVKKNSVAGVRRGRPRSGASEQAILSATLELLAELGFRAVTVDAIAARAGASKSTIYRRWPTKEYLVIAAFAQTPNLAPGRQGTMAEQLIDVIAQFAGFMQATPLGGVLPALAAERTHNPALDGAFGPLVRARRKPLLDIVRAGIAGGELPAGTNAEFAADMFTGPVLQRLMVLGLKTDRRYVRQVVLTACAGLRAAQPGRAVRRRSATEVTGG
ncbi:MAG: TetR/AcrR family transcriptional regulator [Gammaproteobacteria bacterium]|nr:TetR/AcrR family transcriptional regulator [Gammaproteobacteria bacterium]MBP6051930.1 TetR/AcrR family transcriptional regulator [Pseudomonadales bacterium]MBK6581850.1 TetR/AcrR family transcriptional regulator [Gammaproteobacteria bacterium]MBK7520685.1 TetR/AcrR family transcriptional regulator [Gammaproteobacteria bacterium]MBK7728403.1 TetR/AcrR family transcriptional regulator [Gammaproteobacteria bacterium]